MNREEVLETLSIFLSQEEQEYGIVKLGVFGSTARDEMSETSDNVFLKMRIDQEAVYV